MSAHYCSIALASCFSKSLELCILMQFPDVFYTSDLQFGFKRGFSTDLCTGLLKLVSSRCIHQRSKVWCALFDMSKAFDLVDHGLYFLSETYHVLLHNFCCSGIVVNSYILGGMIFLLHLFLYQMVYNRMESYLQSCLWFILMSFCNISET